MFDEWNAAFGGGESWCSSICGYNYIGNLVICAQFLYSAFSKLQELEISNASQMMAMAATAWNGHTCGYNSNGAFFPWSGQSGYYLPGTDQITEYGSSAGYLFANSRHVGNGVFDTSETV